MDYVIYVDVSVDISASVVEENDIRLVPMHCTMGDRELLFDSIQTDEALHEFYDGLRNGEVAVTSQITPNYYEDVFSKEIAAGNGILYISLSGGLSNTYSSSLVAISNLREEHEYVNIETVDSLSATGGMGLLLLLAIRNRKAGMALKENADFLRKQAPNICHWFMVDDLMFLKRGGRVSAATAVVGSALNVKPVLKIDDDGKLVNIAKQRGTNKTLKYLMQNYVESKDFSVCNDVIVIHGDCPEKADELVAMIKEETPEAEVQILTLSPIIGAHTGPGMAAIIHFGNRNYA